VSAPLASIARFVPRDGGYSDASLPLMHYLPRARKDKASRVNEVIDILGLQRCTNTIIRARGSTISGGERKRISIAQELITCPSVLLMDEPTSGLDSASANILVSTCTDLVKAGRTIICTIHQPSAAIFKKFNKLLLLSTGEAVFYGSSSCCLGWFNALGATCPMGMSAAEFIIDVATGSSDLQVGLCA
jgi:ABC-type multidrug transport system ATPase subunit